MRAVFGLVLIIGLALAGGAVYLAKNYIGSYQAELAKARSESAPSIPTEKVVVMKHDVEYGETITAEDVAPVDFPSRIKPEGVFLTMEEIFPNGDDQPRVVLRPMLKYEPVLASKVTEPGKDAGLTSRLEKGMRAFAIKVDVASGVSGFLRPGDRVDVYWTGRVGGENYSSDSAGMAGGVTKLIESKVKIIAIDQMADAQIGETLVARTVTVAISPAQVAALAQAQSTGRLSLSLVGADDDLEVSAVEIDQRRLLGLAAAPVTEQAVEEKKCTIKTRRGGEVIEMPIPCTN